MLLLPSTSGRRVLQLSDVLRRRNSGTRHGTEGTSTLRRSDIARILDEALMIANEVDLVIQSVEASLLSRSIDSCNGAKSSTDAADDLTAADDSPTNVGKEHE